MTEQKKIVVSESPLPDQLGALLRQVILIVGPWLVARNYLADDTVDMLAGLAVLGALIWGQVKTRQKSKQVVASAMGAPVSVKPKGGVK